MKRFITVFGVIVIITMHCLSFYPAKAAITSVDYGEMLNIYLGAAETALATSQGVTIDWSTLELPDDSNTWTDKQKAQYIVQYVGNIKNVGLYAIYDWLFGEGNDTQDIISAETAAIGLSNNSNLNTLDIKAQLDNILATQSQGHIFQRYSDKVIARWNEYNTNYINDYLALFAGNEPDVSVNVSASNFNNYNNVVAGSIPSWATFTVNSSLLCYGYPTSSYSQSTHFPLTNGWFPFFGNLYFDNYDGYWKLTADGYVTTAGLTSGVPVASATYVNGYWDQIGTGNNAPTDLTSRINPYIRNIDSNNIAALLNKVPDFSRNCTVYVNGVLYNYNSISSGLTVNLPDAVIDSGTDDGKIVAHPIYYPDTMNTDKAIDIDLDKVVDAIAQRIADGASDITFDDLVDAGAAVKLDGTTLTDVDTIVKDVSVPIARAKVDTIDGVVPTIDIVPPLPPLPPLTPGDYSGEGFNGMSVLARIINATVQGLPEPLILTFFGVVFGAVILGIIKILHH